MKRGMVLALLLAGCHRAESTASEKPAVGSSRPSLAGAAAPAPQPQPPLEVSSPSAKDPNAERMQRWQRYGEALEDASDCSSTYGINLRVAWPSQLSRKAWLRELLLVEPEFRPLLDSGELRLVWAVYGLRNYGRGVDTSDISREALTVTCKTPALCHAFAGLYGRIDPDARSEQFCGALPGRSGGDFPVDLDALGRLARSHPHGTCARYRACLARLERPNASCDGFEKSAASCAAEPDCEKALACFDKEPRNPKKPLWSDAPSATGSGNFGY